MDELPDGGRGDRLGWLIPAQASQASRSPASTLRRSAVRDPPIGPLAVALVPHILGQVSHSLAFTQRSHAITLLTILGKPSHVALRSVGCAWRGETFQGFLNGRS